MLKPQNCTTFLNCSTVSKAWGAKLHEYVRSCHKCQIMNLPKPNFIDLHQDIAQTPQDHLSIDLLGPFNVTSQGNSYALTAVCNLTGYLMTTPIKDKMTTSVANHLFLDIMLKFGFPRISHSDSGTEFKSKLMEQLSQQHCIRKNFHFPSPPTRKWKTRIFTHIYQGLYLKIFSRWCPWMGPITPICNSCISLVS